MRGTVYETLSRSKGQGHKVTRLIFLCSFCNEIYEWCLRLPAGVQGEDTLSMSLKGETPFHHRGSYECGKSGLVCVCCVYYVYELCIFLRRLILLVSTLAK